VIISLHPYVIEYIIVPEIFVFYSSDFVLAVSFTKISLVVSGGDGQKVGLICQYLKV